MFDDISEANILNEKRLKADKVRKKTNDPSMSSVGPPENESEQAAPSGGEMSSAAAMDKFEMSMMKGFQMISKSFENFGDKLIEKMDLKLDQLHDSFGREAEGKEGDGSHFEPISDDELEVLEDEEANIFEKLADGAPNTEVAGPKVHDALAKLANGVLAKRMTTELNKVKCDKYPRPENVGNACVPKTNKAVWEAMTFWNRKTDAKLQVLQKNVIKSSLPIIQTMQQLFENRDSPENIKVDEIITTLSDSIDFIGSANLDICKLRRENVKKDINKNMQGLCRDTDEFYPDQLFGSDLNSKIKEVTETNKLKSKVATEDLRKKSGFRGGRNRGKWRGGFGKNKQRYVPYPKNYNAPKNGPASKGGPSNKA